MNRLQKKCLFLSLLAHALLLVGLGLVAAFRPTPPAVPDDLQWVDLTHTKLTDEPFSGGGDPAPAARPAPEASPPPKMAPAVPETRPEPPVEVKPAKAKAAKVQEEEEPIEKAKSPDDWTLTPKPKPEKKFTLVRKTTKDRLTAKDDAADEEAEQADKAAKARKAEEARKTVAQARADAINRVTQRLSGSLSQLQNNLSSGVSIQPVGGTGTGGMGGGQAYQNWTSAVSALYRSYFSPPGDCPDSMVAVVEVTILRDGTVKSEEFTKPSGDRDYDHSVNVALRRVRKVPPFPEGAKDTRRVLRISFVPTPKRSPE
jgi:TonB family protein